MVRFGSKTMNKPAQGEFLMRRLVILLCFLVLALAGLVASLPLLVSSDTVRTAIVQRLSELTGREVAFRGNPTVQFRPFLAIEISDLTISDQNADTEDASLLSVEKVQAQLEIIPALMGDISLDKFRLLRPRLNLKVYPDGQSSWHFDKGQLFEAFYGTSKSILKEDKFDQIVNTRLGNFTIVDGAMQYEDTIADSIQEITSMNGVITWPQTNTGAQIEGVAIWRGENINFNTSFQEPMTLMAGGETEVSINIESTPVNLTFEGSANMLSNLFFNGKLQLSTPSTTRLSDILETRIGNFGSLKLIGDVEATAKTMRLTDAAIEVSENAAEGVISISFDEVGDSKIDGTLAFEDLDFSTAFAIQPPQGEGQINDPGRNTRIDLRVSANTINAGFTQLEQVAAIVRADEHGWTVDIGDAQAFDGSLIAKFGETIIDEKTLAFLDSSAIDVDTSTIFGLFEENRIKLSGNANFNTSLRGKDLASLLMRRNISGSFDIQLTDGALEGIDLPGLLEELKTGEANQQVQALPAGSTPAKELSMSLFITDSVASIGKSSLVSGDTRIQLLGSIDVRQGNLALRAQEITDEGPEPERLFLGGTLKDPLISLKRIRKTEDTTSGDKIVVGVWN